MNLSKMKSLETDEIVSVIEKAALFGGVIHQQGSLQIHDCAIHKFELKDSRVVLYILGKHRLDGVHPLSVNLAYRNLTFRVLPHELRLFEDKVICHIPLEAKALDIRAGGARHVLPLDSSVTASVRRIEKRDSLCDFQVQVVDVSKTGLGAFLSGPTEGLLSKYDHLWIKEINQQKLASPIFARAEYVNERKYKDNTSVLRVGLSTDKQLPDEVYQELISKCHLVLSA